VGRLGRGLRVIVRYSDKVPILRVFYFLFLKIRRKNYFLSVIYSKINTNNCNIIYLPVLNLDIVFSSFVYVGTYFLSSTLLTSM
jgi:hypothetical protein